MLQVEVCQRGSFPKDRDRVLSLIQKQMESIGAPKTMEQLDQTLATILGSESQAVLFIGHEPADGAPIGFAFGNLGLGFESGGAYFWLNELYVDALCRGKGYAQALLSFVEGWLKERGVKYIAGITGADNAAARGLYRKIGFNLDSIVLFDKDL